MCFIVDTQGHLDTEDSKSHGVAKASQHIFHWTRGSLSLYQPAVVTCFRVSVYAITRGIIFTLVTVRGHTKKLRPSNTSKCYSLQHLKTSHVPVHPVENGCKIYGIVYTRRLGDLTLLQATVTRCFRMQVAWWIHALSIATMANQMIFLLFI